MSSSDRLNPQQLQMFMPAGELRQKTANDFVVESTHFNTSDVPPHYHHTQEAMWELKLREAKDRTPPSMPGEAWRGSLYDTIKAEGVLEPVRVHVDEGGVILDGHHRIAAAADIDPTMEVPMKNIGSLHQRGIRHHRLPLHPAHLENPCLEAP